MEQIASPDRPAYFCYLIVIVVGLWVAYGKVNRLMASSVGRWSFLETWLVFGAYAVVPVLLFWFLDFANALHDTSLFAALLVALGYRQILAGEMKGTSVPGQLSALWSPFEAWANQVRERVFNKNTVRSSRFNEKLRVALAQTPERVADLTELAYLVADDRAQLVTDLQAIANEPRPAEIPAPTFEHAQARRRVDRCLQSIRKVSPEDYGFMLRRRGLIDRFQYWVWLGNASTRMWQIVGVIIISVLLLVLAGFFFRHDNLLRYHHWRFGKSNTTEPDRFRTRTFFNAEIKTAAAASGKKAFELIEPMIRMLRYRDIDRRASEDTLSLVLEFRQPKLDAFTIPLLIETLRTENPDVRLRSHQALQRYRNLTYGKPAEDDELAKWVPSKNESAADVEDKIKQYIDWWQKTRQSAATSTP
jgi:hypothetical protein